MVACGAELLRAIIAANQCLLFEPESPSAQKFQEIAIARRQQAAEALELRGSRGPEAAPYLDDSDVPSPFELDMLESTLILATGARRAAAQSIPILSGHRPVWTASALTVDARRARAVADVACLIHCVVVC